MYRLEFSMVAEVKVKPTSEGFINNTEFSYLDRFLGGPSEDTPNTPKDNTPDKSILFTFSQKDRKKLTTRKGIDYLDKYL